MKRKLIAVSAVTLLFAAGAQADVVRVSVSGRVLFNGIGDPPLNGVGPNEQATMSFEVDSSNFVEGVPDDTRGYVIDESSFSLAFSGGVSVGLENPYPGTPYFTLVDGFPVSDGFFVSNSPSSPGGVDLEQTPYSANLELGYTGDTLGSLDILDALGTYDFAGLTRFAYTIWRGGPDNVVMEMDFQSMTIALPAPSAALLLPLGLAAAGRRRRA